MRIPAPKTNLRLASAYARKWVSRIGQTRDDGLGREYVPFRVHSAAHRLVTWAEARAGVRS